MDITDQKRWERYYWFDTLHGGLGATGVADDHIGLKFIEDILYELNQALNGA